MRIIYLHQYFNTPDMAGGTRSYEMARRLVASGHEVNMVTSWREPSARNGWFVTNEAGITVHWLPVPYSNHMRAVQRIKAFMRFACASSRKAVSLPGDVVFATSTPLTIALPGMFASRCKRIPMVFEVRDLWPEVFIEMKVLKNPVAIKLARALEGMAYRHSTRIVALAPGMKEAICRRGVDSSRVTVIPNGCDFDIFADQSLEPVQLPGSKNKSLGVAYIGTMGLLHGAHYVPRLAAEIRRISGLDPVCFYMIGDGSHRQDCEALAGSLGVLNSAVYFVGQLTKREAARWLAAADATIVTCDGPEIVIRDSVFNKFFDSIAAGKPVLANFSGFSTRIAVEAGAGFIMSRDPAVAAEELLRIAGNPSTLREAGKQAFALAVRSFSRDRLTSQLESVLQDAVSSP